MTFLLAEPEGQILQQQFLFVSLNQVRLKFCLMSVDRSLFVIWSTKYLLYLKRSLLSSYIRNTFLDYFQVTWMSSQSCGYKITKENILSYYCEIILLLVYTIYLLNIFEEKKNCVKFKKKMLLLFFSIFNFRASKSYI